MLKKLNYNKVGEGSDPILMLPGWGFTNDIWQEVARELSKNNLIYLIDLPGMGMNKHVSFNGIDELLEIFNNTFTEKCTWLGWSFGGMLSLLYAATYNNNVNKVVALNTTLKWTSAGKWSSMPPSSWEKFTKFFHCYPDKCFEWFAKNQLPVGCKDEKYMQVESHLKNNLSKDKNKVISKYLTLLGELDLRYISCCCPVNFIYSIQDKILPSMASENTIKNISDEYKVITIKDAGHAPFLTNIDGTVDAIRSLI